MTPIYLCAPCINTHIYTGYAKLVFNDSCYEEASEIGALSWNPPQHFEHRYEVLYTPAMCSASTSNVTVQYNLTYETSITLPPSEVYCIQVNSIINASSCSKCAQVASLMQSMKCITFSLTVPLSL